MFDNASCYPATENYSALKSRYADSSAIVYMGINSVSQRLTDYYKDLAESDVISTDTIRFYLDTLKDFLHNDKGMFEIKAEVKEEYGYPYKDCTHYQYAYNKSEYW